MSEKLERYSKIIVATLVLSILVGCGKNSIPKQQLEGNLDSGRTQTEESRTARHDALMKEDYNNAVGTLAVGFLALGIIAALYGTSAIVNYFCSS